MLYDRFLREYAWHQQAPEKRFKLLKVSCEVLVHLLSLKGDILVSIQGMPEDARITGGYYCIESDAFIFRVDSKEFSIVREGHYPGNLDLSSTGEKVFLAEEVATEANP